MCGITGYFNPEGFKFIEAKDTLIRMRDQLTHRGPDDAGIWLDYDKGIAIAQRRLSIQDLTPAGHQPMISTSGRYVIVFNGEVYNHIEIRQTLEVNNHQSWRGHSDTETLLAAIELWGLDKALKKCVGMFAIALWDRKYCTLSLARDRMGEKPLYYGWQGGTLLFGSELKALTLHPDFKREMDLNVLPLYFKHGYIPAPWCIWNAIHKLPPGTWVEFSAHHIGQNIEPTTYWSLNETIVKGQLEPFIGSDQDAINELESRLGTAINGQRLADVPVGAFLSGGIDSSVVVSLMQAQASRPIKTFTIGFRENGYNEAEHAKSLASHLGTDHTELYVTSEQAMDVLQLLPTMYDEPFGDSSAIPTHILCRLARENVTVSLSGDGGDELFGGYRRYQKAQNTFLALQHIPKKLRDPAVKLLRSKLPGVAEEIFSPFLKCLGRPTSKSITMLSSTISNLVKCNTQLDLYKTAIKQWNPPPILRKEVELSYGFNNENLEEILEPIQQMMAFDSVTYLPDDILVKLDRASMSVSLESRVPLLDHRIIELAWQFPYEMKVRNNQEKWLLRQVLYRYIPIDLVERPKMGFGLPINEWLRGALREWGEELLNTELQKHEEYLDSTSIRKRWNDHIEGRNNWSHSIWLVLMLLSWLRINVR